MISRKKKKEIRAISVGLDHGAACSRRTDASAIGGATCPSACSNVTCRSKGSSLVSSALTQREFWESNDRRHRPDGNSFGTDCLTCS
ncbi:hypothetical protein EVAR_46963_1 [Eumeta japonica]|uniref:Uncharacterized protein n=1 Tax=Eumeta variegata TaxID=151549 RepID=A0A4C1YP20_EUMVA|nr:hypothetical protein EVAR_46963_1 [Eumeta japonica]